ncbi:MAG: 4Fe-4S cluster-binding domain-containing protein [Bacteroidaceae bacterium]|nr:4Fe-4S cluster-binding domain-containing protein [Bacteroidaceae bacterium]
MIKYTDAQITFREVPNEISLSINISNCPYRCIGCHSPYLQKDIGKELTIDVLKKLIDENKDKVTCVTFLGDGGNIKEIAQFVKYCNDLGYLTCLYTGSTDMDEIVNECEVLDFIKIGPYIKEKGGLDSPTTNQRFYEIRYSYDNDDEWIEYRNLTDKFLIKY